jgi:altronate hydrolase
LVSNPIPDALRIHVDDGVAVALRDLSLDEVVTLDLGRIRLIEPIPAGHKFAVRAHESGGIVVKFGQPIGRATGAIAVGAHVHTHNLVTALGGELRYASHPVAPRRNSTNGTRHRWQGYRRADGSTATRNEVWILPTVGCVGVTAEHLARTASVRHAGRIDGIHAFAHPHGCSQLGDDLSGTRALLAALAANPNAAGVLLLGLGCESNQLDALLDAVPSSARRKVRILRSQSAGDEMAEAGALIDTLVEEAASARRSDMTLADLTIGLKCGGSDGLSGLTANPLLGRLSDTVSTGGGRMILTEIPEIFGAEQAPLDRATDAAVFDAAAGLVNRFKRYFLDQGQPVSENPSPGNLAGGITTLEEKSLGAVQKAGQAPLSDVIDYGGQARVPGVTLLEAPGNDAVSSTALAAAGATMVLFTTGRGTPLGFPVPTVKIASNNALATHKPHWIDFDASRILDEDRDAVDGDFLASVLATASGTPTASECAGQRSIAIWKRGVTL